MFPITLICISAMAEERLQKSNIMRRTLCTVCACGRGGATRVQGRMHRISDPGEYWRMHLAKSVVFTQEEDEVSRRILL